MYFRPRLVMCELSPKWWLPLGGGLRWHLGSQENLVMLAAWGFICTFSNPENQYYKTTIVTYYIVLESVSKKDLNSPCVHSRQSVDCQLNMTNEKKLSWVVILGTSIWQALLSNMLPLVCSNNNLLNSKCSKSIRPFSSGLRTANPLYLQGLLCAFH